MDQPHPLIPADSIEYRLHPKVPSVWTGITSIVFAIPAIAGTVVLAVFGFWYLAPLPIVFGALLSCLLYRYYVRHVAALRCTLSPIGLLIVRGVWWRSQTFVPRQRVQHTDVDQGPLARRYGMATLRVFTAGSEHSQIEVDGLHHAEAVAVRDDLIDRAERTS